MTNAAAERAQDIRDLRGQISELRGSEDEQEVIFRDVSPRRRKVSVYSMTDGEEILIPHYMLTAVLDKRLADGSFMFTARQHEAPLYKLGEVKCFLHPDAPERALLLDIGLGAVTCPAEHLANLHSKRMHGIHRHGQEWAAYQEALNEQKEEDYRARQDAQLQATLEIARAASTKKTTA